MPKILIGVALDLFLVCAFLNQGKDAHWYHPTRLLDKIARQQILKNDDALTNRTIFLDI